MVFQKKPRRSGSQRVARPTTLQPPVRGWVLSESLANAKSGGARVLENWFPTKSGARLRGGCRQHAKISTGPVRRMWTFKSGSAEQFFASDDTKIFEITNVANPNAIPAAKVSGRSAGYYSTAQFGTAGGNYQYLVNGADDALLYDGLTFKAINTLSSPAITGVASASFSFVWSFSNRLFFVEKNTMNSWFLPVDSIGGAAQLFSLAGVFQEGGSLLCGGKWSMDSGDGLDDKCVFISTEGEVAVYQGTTPGDASSWSKVGVYKITPPMGPNGQMQAGGDLLIATEDGIVPISEAVNKDVAALSLSAVTRDIEPAWKTEVIARRTLPWEIMKWPTNNMMVVSQPVPDAGISPGCLVANMETGAWAKFTDWDTRCLGHFAGYGYFGTNAGTIHQMEIGGSDDGVPYTCTYVGLPDHLRAAAVYKTLHSARAVFLSSVPFIPKISASADYQIRLPTPPSSVEDFDTDEWDSGKWDVSQWDSAGEMEVHTRWVSVGRSGFVVSPQIQITCGITPFPRTELIAFDVLYETGAVQV